MHAGLAGDELNVDPQDRADLSDASLQHIADAEFSADLPYVGGLALVSVGGLPRDHPRAGNA